MKCNNEGSRLEGFLAGVVVAIIALAIVALVIGFLALEVFLMGWNHPVGEIIANALLFIISCGIVGAIRGYAPNKEEK